MAADEAAYWNALASLRRQRPRYAASPVVTTGSCQNPADTGAYFRACDTNIAWVEFGVSGVVSQEQLHALLFPKDYFDWCKSYLRVALDAKPRPDASARARVYWSLDVLTRIYDMVVALGIPTAYNSTVLGTGSEAGKLVAGFIRNPALEPLFRSLDARQDKVLTLYNALLSRYDKPPLQDRFGQKVTLPDLGGVYFDVRWTRPPFGFAPYGNAAHPRTGKISASQQRAAIARAQSMPWLDGVDHGALTARSRAAMQLAFWVPGSTLEEYIASVQAEGLEPFTFSGGGPAGSKIIKPGFGFEYMVIDAFVRAATQLDYESILKSHLRAWAQRNDPKVDAAGELRGGVDQPVTMTDYRELWIAAKEFTQLRAKIETQLAYERTGQYRQALTRAMDVGVPGSGQALSKLYSYMQKALALLPPEVLAVGAVDLPFYAISNPFVRSMRNPELRTVADGPTVFYYARLVEALGSLQAISGIDLGFGPPKPSFRLPDDFPISSATTTLESRAAEKARLRDACVAVLFQWTQQNPEQARCLNASDMEKLLDLCMRHASGEISFPAMAASADAFVSDRCQEYEATSFFSVLRKGFENAANPYTLFRRS